LVQYLTFVCVAVIIPSLRGSLAQHFSPLVSNQVVMFCLVTFVLLCYHFLNCSELDLLYTSLAF